jgi:DNA-binding MarR family transcriptional regulator
MPSASPARTTLPKITLGTNTARKTVAKTAARPARKPAAAADESIGGNSGTEYLETLLGYNASRASQTLVSHFIRGMRSFDLRTVDFSVLSVIGHRPGDTSRQLCQQLNVLPPNMVILLRDLDKRGLIERHPHPTDRRAIGLRLSKSGQSLMKQAEKVASEADRQGTAHLSATERQTLARLLQKVYKGESERSESKTLISRSL